MGVQRHGSNMSRVPNKKQHLHIQNFTWGTPNVWEPHVFFATSASKDALYRWWTKHCIMFQIQLLFALPGRRWTKKIVAVSSLLLGHVPELFVASIRIIYLAIYTFVILSATTSCWLCLPSWSHQFFLKGAPHPPTPPVPCWFIVVYKSHINNIITN